MTLGPPTVGKTTLKEQLLGNGEENIVTVEGEHDRPPSSPVCEEVKRIQIILDDKKSKQSPCTVSADKYNWKTLTLGEEVIDLVKNMSKRIGEDFTREETVFWSIYAAVISICHISIVIYKVSEVV